MYKNKKMRLCWLLSALLGASGIVCINKVEVNHARFESAVAIENHNDRESGDISRFVVKQRDWPIAEASSPFSPISWYVPPPPPPKPVVVPPEPPKPPPIPFKYLGSIILDGKDKGYQILVDDRVVALTNGMKVTDQYEYIGEKNGLLKFIYLPMKTEQALVIVGGG